MARQLTSDVNTELQKGEKRSASIAKDEYHERENTSQQQRILSHFFQLQRGKKEIIDDTLWDRDGFLLVVSIHDVTKREENTGRSMSK